MWREWQTTFKGNFFMIIKKNQMLVLEMFFVIHLYLNFFLHFFFLSFFIYLFITILFPSTFESPFQSCCCCFLKLLDIHKSEQNSIMNPYIYFIYKKKFFVEIVFLYYQDCRFTFWTGGWKLHITYRLSYLCQSPRVIITDVPLKVPEVTSYCHALPPCKMSLGFFKTWDV